MHCAFRNTRWCHAITEELVNAKLSFKNCCLQMLPKFGLVAQQQDCSLYTCNISKMVEVSVKEKCSWKSALKTSFFGSKMQI